MSLTHLRISAQSADAVVRQMNSGVGSGDRSSNHVGVQQNSCNNHNILWLWLAVLLTAFVICIVLLLWILLLLLLRLAVCKRCMRLSKAYVAVDGSAFADSNNNKNLLWFLISSCIFDLYKFSLHFPCSLSWKFQSANDFRTKFFDLLTAITHWSGNTATALVLRAVIFFIDVGKCVNFLQRAWIEEMKED